MVRERFQKVKRNLETNLEEYQNDVLDQGLYVKKARNK